jgi:hypothetical protein
MPITLAKLGPELDRHLLEALKQKNWKAHLISPAVYHSSKVTPEPRHVHLVGGRKVKARGYEKPAPGRIDLNLTCPIQVANIERLKMQGAMFLYLN